MTITKEEILAHLNKELNRTETDIDEHILEALKDLSLQNEFLWIESTVKTIAGRPYYSMPLDYRKKLSIRIDDENSMKLIDWGEYQALIANETEADWGMPNRFCIHGGYWYGYPTADAEYTATIFYNAFILEQETIDEVTTKAVDDIKFKDIYRSAINAKTKAQYCRSLGWIDRAKEYEADYRALILPPLEELIQRQVREVQYHDW